jgi:hypothetical protein
MSNHQSAEDPSAAISSEEADEKAPHGADRPASTEESEAAEKARSGVEVGTVGEHFQEMSKRGGQQRQIAEERSGHSPAAD